MEKLDYSSVFENVVKGLSQYLIKNGIKCTILGCSGGLDSTVCAAICHEVYNRTGIPLYGVSLPTSTNQEDEIVSAELCGKEFCTKFNTVNIENLFEQTNNVFSSYGYSPTKISMGNIKARIRGSFLYNLASMCSGIVIDTDNLTEYYLGFWTIRGGDEGDVSPIGGLWKHEVYELARWMKDNVYPDSEALKAAIEIVPTDGNGVKAGGDLAQIAPGTTYEIVDDILLNWVGFDDKAKKKIIEEGKFDYRNLGLLRDRYGFDTVASVCSRSFRSEFKRRHIPLMIDIDSGSVTDKEGRIIA